MDPYTKEEIQAMRASMLTQLIAEVEHDYYYNLDHLISIKPFLEDAVKCKSIVNALQKYQHDCDHKTTNNRFGNSRALDTGCVAKYVDFKLKTALTRNPSTSISELKEIFIAIFKNVWSKGYSKETAQYFGNAVANFVYEDFISQKKRDEEFEKECERKTKKGKHTSASLHDCQEHSFEKYRKIRKMEKESENQEKRRPTRQKTGGVSNAQLEEKKAAAKLKREEKKAATKLKREEKKAATKLKTCKKNIEQIDKKRVKLTMQLHALEKKRNDLNC
jgi:hypothetical protein